MQLVSGFKPAPWCCSDYNMDNANIEYVSDAVYDKVAQESQSTQIQWVGIKLGNASGWEIGRLDLFKSLNVEVKTFHSSLLQDQDKPLQFSRKIERSPPGPGKAITIQPQKAMRLFLRGTPTGRDCMVRTSAGRAWSCLQMHPSPTLSSWRFMSATYSLTISSARLPSGTMIHMLPT